MNISKKKLSLIIITLTIIIAISTLILITKLSSEKTTSLATYDEGLITLEIEKRLSITTIDGEFIDFGQCALLGREFNITSDGLKDTENSCLNFNQTNISVRNNGNVLARIHIQTDKVGAANNGTFLQTLSNTSKIAYKITNAGRLGNEGGCTQTLGPQTFTVFEQSNQEYDVCERLEYIGLEGNNNSIIANFEILIPQDANLGLSEVIITFTAEEYI